MTFLFFARHVEALGGGGGGHRTGLMVGMGCTGVTTLHPPPFYNIHLCRNIDCIRSFIQIFHFPFGQHPENERFSLQPLFVFIIVVLLFSLFHCLSMRSFNFRLKFTDFKTVATRASRFSVLTKRNVGSLGRD